MRIYPEKGANPTASDYQALATAALAFGLGAIIGREKTKSGYKRYVEIVRPVEFGIEKAAPSVADSKAAQENNLS